MRENKKQPKEYRQNAPAIIHQKIANGRTSQIGIVLHTQRAVEFVDPSKIGRNAPVNAVSFRHREQSGSSTAGKFRCGRRCHSKHPVRIEFGRPLAGEFFISHALNDPKLIFGDFAFGNHLLKQTGSDHADLDISGTDFIKNDLHRVTGETNAAKEVFRIFSPLLDLTEAHQISAECRRRNCRSRSAFHVGKVPDRGVGPHEKDAAHRLVRIGSFMNFKCCQMPGVCPALSSGEEARIGDEEIDAVRIECRKETRYVVVGHFYWALPCNAKKTDALAKDFGTVGVADSIENGKANGSALFLCRCRTDHREEHHGGNQCRQSFQKALPHAHAPYGLSRTNCSRNTLSRAVPDRTD